MKNKNDVLNVIVPLGKLLRSNKVTLTLTGDESLMAQVLIQKLEELAKALDSETLVIGEAAPAPKEVSPNGVPE